MNTEQVDLVYDTELPKFSTYDLGKVVKSQNLPEIEVFKHINFNFQTETIPLQDGEKVYHENDDKIKGGRLALRTSFNVDLKDHSLDKNISSVIIYSGYWQFFNYEGNPFPPILGPGHYPSVGDLGIPNDSISSFKCVGF